jgi:hypothetical protein
MGIADAYNPLLLIATGVQWRNLDVPGMERLQQPRHSASSFAPAISMMKTAKPGADGRPGAEL